MSGLFPATAAAGKRGLSDVIIRSLDFSIAKSHYVLLQNPILHREADLGSSVPDPLLAASRHG